MNIGVQFSTLNVEIYNYTFMSGLTGNAAAIVLWFLLFMYLEQVLPSEFGIPRKWYYPFQIKSFWIMEVFGQG